MSQALCPSGNVRYGLARVCLVWELARSTAVLTFYLNALFLALFFGGYHALTTIVGGPLGSVPPRSLSAC